MKVREELVSKLTIALNDNPLILAFLLVGSLAREQNDLYAPDDYSDMEGFVVVKDKDIKKVEKELFDIVEKLGKVVFTYKNRWAGFSVLYDNLFRLELPITGISEIEPALSRPKAQPVKILIDKTNGVLDKVLSKRPETVDFKAVFDYEVKDFWYMSVVACQYYKRGELHNTRSALNITTASIIKFFEMLTNPDILLLETNKRIEQFLSDDKITVIKKLDIQYDKNAIKDALENSFEVFLEATKNVSEKYGFKYDSGNGKAIQQKLLELLKN